MRTLWLACVFCAIAFCAIAKGADATGKWTGGIPTAPIYLILKQDGASITGSGGPSENQQALLLEKGTIEGNRLILQAGAIQFDLTLNGDDLRGEVRRGDDVIPVTLRRVGAAPAPSADSPRRVFEVASIKPNKSGNFSSTGRGGAIRATRGQIAMENVTLWKAIGAAYGIGEDRDYAMTGPGWLKSERYDITAKLPTDATYQDVQEMLRNLLADRFHMKVHHESKEMPVYALIAAKAGPKLKPAEPGRGNFRMGPGEIKAQGTLGALADRLSQTLDRPVIDMTGIAGTFEMLLTWMPEAPAVPGEHAAGGEGPSIFTAIQEQLGLRLEARKGTVDVLVVDEAVRVPTEN